MNGHGLRRWLAALSIAAWTLGGAAACSDSPSAPGSTLEDATAGDARLLDASDAGAPDAAPGDAEGTDAGGPMPCGSSTCEAGHVCVHPCCGGAAPLCEPATDAGTCAPGSEVGQCLDGQGRPALGCAHACEPPAPYCAPIPAACGDTPACTCFPSDVCSQGSCGLVGATGIACLCA